MTGNKFGDTAVEQIGGVIQRDARRRRNERPRKPGLRLNVQARYLGKTDAAISKGATGTVSIYTGTTKGSEADTGRDKDAYNRMAAIDAAKWVYVEWIDGGWEVYQAEC